MEHGEPIFKIGMYVCICFRHLSILQYDVIMYGFRGLEYLTLRIYYIFQFG